MIDARSVLTALLLAIGLAAPAAAQRPADAVPSEPIELASLDREAADRAYLVGFLGRSEVRHAARIAGVDLDATLAGVSALEGDRLANAAQQARVIDRQIVQADDIISIRATTLIILLLLLIIVLIAA